MILSFDAPPEGVSRVGWKRHPCVLVDFAKEVLVIDELQLPPPKRFELQTKSTEFVVCYSRDGFDDFLGLCTPQVGETLADPCSCTGARYYELAFGKVNHLAVVQVNRKLESKKIPE